MVGIVVVVVVVGDRTARVVVVGSVVDRGIGPRGGTGSSGGRQRIPSQDSLLHTISYA